MIPFDEIWPLTDVIPGSFTRLSGEMFYRYASQCPSGEVMVEVGVDQGRSASLLLQAASQTGAEVILVDSWESVLIENKDKVRLLVSRFPGIRKVTIMYGLSIEAARNVSSEISFLHVDANHYDDNPAMDCEAWLPKIKRGGTACFHDYGHTFPAVTAAVDQYTKDWVNLGVYDGLAIRRKP